jgi:hypothetical protein
VVGVEVDGGVVGGLVLGDEAFYFAVGAEELLGLLDDLVDIQRADALLRCDQRGAARLLRPAALALHQPL